MKRVTTLLLALLLAFGCLSAFAADIPSELPTGTLTEDARAYKSNSTKSGTAVKLKKGAEVTIVGETDSFYWVISGNDAGYVLKKYVDLAGEEAKAEEAEKEVTRKNIGTRKTPAIVGETVTFNVDTYYAKGTVALKLSQIVTGADAWAMVYGENMFNDPPRDGYEYVAAKFVMKFIKNKSGEDAAASFSTYNFEYAAADYSLYDLPSIVDPEPEFSVKLYEGATSSGWVVLEVKKGEAAYAVFSPSYNSTTIWYDLRS